MKYPNYPAYIIGLFLLTQTSCGADEVTSHTDPTPSVPVAALCTEMRELKCVDNMTLDLSFQDKVATAEVSSLQEGSEWVSLVDATAGGFGNASTNPWIYIKFTEQGAEKVEITDNESLESMQWHIAAHRYKIRLNSGTGGPSCVRAAALLEGNYDSIAQAPQELTFYEDSFYTADCSLISDTGLGDPQFYMSSWWEYPGCVKTTGVPFLIQLDTGRTLKLRIEEYYQSGQENCNDNGTPGSGSGNLKLRWKFL